MTNEPKPSIDELLVDKTIMMRAMILGLGAGNLTGSKFGQGLLTESISEAALLGFVESVIVSVRKKKNEHAAHHAERYDHSCAFCVDVIYTTNQPEQNRQGGHHG